eukprot:RCo050633
MAAFSLPVVSTCSPLSEVSRTKGFCDEMGKDNATAQKAHTQAQFYYVCVLAKIHSYSSFCVRRNARKKQMPHTFFIKLTKDIEHEMLHVVVHCFVIQEKFR